MMVMVIVIWHNWTIVVTTSSIVTRRVWHWRLLLWVGDLKWRRLIMISMILKFLLMLCFKIPKYEISLTMKNKYFVDGVMSQRYSKLTNLLRFNKIWNIFFGKTINGKLSISIMVLDINFSFTKSKVISTTEFKKLITYVLAIRKKIVHW